MLGSHDNQLLASYSDPMIAKRHYNMMYIYIYIHIAYCLTGGQRIRDLGSLLLFWRIGMAGPEHAAGTSRRGARSIIHQPAACLLVPLTSLTMIFLRLLIESPA